MDAGKFPKATRRRQRDFSAVRLRSRLYRVGLTWWPYLTQLGGLRCRSRIAGARALPRSPGSRQAPQSLSVRARRVLVEIGEPCRSSVSSYPFPSTDEAFQRRRDTILRADGFALIGVAAR